MTTDVDHRPHREQWRATADGYPRITLYLVRQYRKPEAPGHYLYYDSNDRHRQKLLCTGEPPTFRTIRAVEDVDLTHSQHYRIPNVTHHCEECFELWWADTPSDGGPGIFRVEDWV